MKITLALILIASVCIACGSGSDSNSETLLSCPVTIITDITQEQYDQMLEEGQEVAVIDYQEMPYKRGDTTVNLTVEVCKDVIDDGNTTIIEG